MGDAADAMGAMKAVEQYRRAQDRESGPEKLTAAGIEFKVFNGGAHLRINAKGLNIDLWCLPLVVFYVVDRTEV